MFKQTVNSARIWGVLFAVFALSAGYDVATAKQSILIPALGLVGFGAMAVASFITSKRLQENGEAPSKANAMETGFLAVGIIAILARIALRYF